MKQNLVPVWTLSFSTDSVPKSQFGLYKTPASHDFGLVHGHNNHNVKTKLVLDFLTTHFFNSAVEEQIEKLLTKCIAINT